MRPHLDVSGAGPAAPDAWSPKVGSRGTTTYNHDIQQANGGVVEIEIPGRAPSVLVGSWARGLVGSWARDLRLGA